MTKLSRNWSYLKPFKDVSFSGFPGKLRMSPMGGTGLAFGKWPFSLLSCVFHSIHSAPQFSSGDQVEGASNVHIA